MKHPVDIDFGFLGFYNIKLFDKRDGFNFKVINYPCLTYSNVPTSQSYGIYLSQLLRIIPFSVLFYRPVIFT